MVRSGPRRSFGNTSLLFSRYTLSLAGRVSGEQRGGAAETVDDEVDGDVVVNAKDIAMLERLLLGNDDDDNIEPSDSVAHLDNFDSDDETYDPNHEDYS